MGSNISVVLPVSFLLFLGDLLCVRVMLVGTPRQAVFVRVVGSVKFVRYHCSIFVQECLGGFRCGVYFVDNVGSGCLVWTLTHQKAHPLFLL